MELTLEVLITRLSKSYNPALPPENPYPVTLIHQNPRNRLKKAAVLIPFLLDNGKWHVLFIRRTKKSEDIHSGQVAFPGGRCNTSDQDAIHAAYREVYEETGIAPNDIKYLGRLRDLVTITGYQITPIVGAIPWPYPLVPQLEEVSRIFTIPLDWLINPSNRKIIQRKHPDTGHTFPVIYFDPYDGEILWGASARITHMLLEDLGFTYPDDRNQV